MIADFLFALLLLAIVVVPCLADSGWPRPERCDCPNCRRIEEAK